jgi:pimeloyl-ACP methyl ester carboxylesterase
VGAELGVTLAGLGVFATSYYIGYVISNVFGGFLSDWFGGRSIIASPAGQPTGTGAQRPTVATMASTVGTAPATGVVLVHGLWHGAWAWDAVRGNLHRAGIATAVVDLPLSSLAADVAEVRRTLDEFDRPAVLVGHSYGGAVITEAGSHRQVVHLLYLAAFQLAEGESVGHTLPELNIPPTRLGEALRFSDADEVALDPVLAGELLYNDVTPDVAAASVARLRPVGKAVFGGIPEVISWRSVPSTYVVCTDDLAVHPDLERAMAGRATHSQEWASGHSPAASHPDEVADLIAALTREHDRAGSKPCTT